MTGSDDNGSPGPSSRSRQQAAVPERRQFLRTVAWLSAAGGAVVQSLASDADSKSFPSKGEGEVAAEGGPPSDIPREIPTERIDLGTNHDFVRRLAERQSYRHSYMTGDFDSLEQFVTEGRQRILNQLRYRPDAVDPRPEILARDDCGSHFREKVVFFTAPDTRVPAYVLIPKGLDQPAPALVDLHSHGGMFLFGKEKVIDLGRNHSAMVRYHQAHYDGRPTATELVRRGYVVISIDAFMFGERRVMVSEDRELGWNRQDYSDEAVAALNARCRSKESTIVKSLIFAGLTWPGIVFWDDLRTVDYLVTRPEVDPQRIGCLGISMGGYRSLFLGALEPRIQAAAVVGFMSTTGPMLRRHIDTHSFIHFLPGLHRDLDWPDVATLMAPKPLLVQQCTRDGLFPLEGMRESFDQIAAGYAKAGAPTQFSGRFHDTTHQFTLEMQEEAFAWFDRQLRPGS